MMGGGGAGDNKVIVRGQSIKTWGFF